VLTFWTAMQRFGDAERSAVVRFATGSAKVPLDGFAPPFMLTKDAEHGADALPHAHTCFNQLVLPPYTSAEATAERLMFAARGTEGFDLT
jgi:hypothetical protein